MAQIASKEVMPKLWTASLRVHGNCVTFFTWKTFSVSESNLPTRSENYSSLPETAQGHCTQHDAGVSCSKPCERFPWWLHSHDTEIYFYYLWSRVLWKIFLGINDTFNNCSSSLQSHFSKRLYCFLAQAVNLAPDKPCNSPAPVPAPASGSPPDPSLSSGRACPGRLHVLGQGCSHLLPVTAHFTHPSLTQD